MMSDSEKSGSQRSGTSHAPSRGLARLGVLVPFTNTNLEADISLMRLDGVSAHFARLGGYDSDAIPDAEQMSGLGDSDLTEPLKLLAGVRPHIVLYGCTSATLTHGTSFDQALTHSIRETMGCPTITAAGALVSALRSLKVKRIAFASPYVSEINQQGIDFLSQSGFETVSQAEVTQTLDNYGQGALSPDAVLDLGLRADSDAAQAIVLSCTDMRSVEIIDTLERRTHKPVITSNQAMLFATMNALGLFHLGTGQLNTNQPGSIQSGVDQPGTGGQTATESEHRKNDIGKSALGKSAMDMTAFPFGMLFNLRNGYEISG